MARVTVEDCVTLVPNRFDLVMIAAQRVRQILSGSDVQVSRDHDKNTVVALREIAEQKVDPATLLESLIKGQDKFAPSDDLEEDEEMIDVMLSETAWDPEAHNTAGKRAASFDDDSDDVDLAEGGDDASDDEELA